MKLLIKITFILITIITDPLLNFLITITSNYYFER